MLGGRSSLELGQSCMHCQWEQESENPLCSVLAGQGITASPKDRFIERKGPNSPAITSRKSKGQVKLAQGRISPPNFQDPMFVFIGFRCLLMRCFIAFSSFQFPFCHRTD